MKIGASTSNFYPEPLEDALDTVLGAGFRTVELFLNAPSEREPAFVAELSRKLDAVGASVSAIHPYSSFMEGYFLFSAYERRAKDMLEDYKRNFEVAATLGAPYQVLHGELASGPLTWDQSLERYERVYDVGAAFGVRVAQENVVQYRSQDPAYLQAMRERLGDKAAFVLDVKQTVRCGLPIETVAEAMGDHIVHVHVSDHRLGQDCLPPGTGEFDYRRLFSLLRERRYDGALIVELYRDGFETPQDLVRSASFLEKQVEM